MCDGVCPTAASLARSTRATASKEEGEDERRVDDPISAAGSAGGSGGGPYSPAYQHDTHPTSTPHQPHATTLHPTLYPPHTRPTPAARHSIPACILPQVTCASMSLSWPEPDANGWSIDEYRVWSGRVGLPSPYHISIYTRRVPGYVS